VLQHLFADEGASIAEVSFLFLSDTFTMNVEMSLPLAFELLQRGCDRVFDMCGTEVGTPNK